VDAALLESFGLDPDILHLNHGAFGVAPVAVRQVAAAWRDRAERNPHRFNRVELPPAATAAVAGPGRSVLVDAAHAPGQLNDDIAAFGADHWIGNLHKWAYTPRGSALLWSRPGTEVTPTVLSWQLEDGYAASFDYPGTWDYAGWLAAPDGLAQWEALGGWQTVSRLAGLVSDGQKQVASALGVPLERLPAVPAPAMRLIPLPDGVLPGPAQATAFYEAPSRERVEVAPIHFGWCRLPPHSRCAVQHPRRLRPPG
jgi:hypothetical protein